MPDYQLLALTPVQATGLSAKTASETARTALDNAHQILDDTTPAGDLTTGPTVILDRGALAGLLGFIRDDANTAINGGGSTRAALYRIRRNAEQLLKAIGAVGAADAATDADLIRNLRAATAHARDLRDAPGTSLEDRAQYQAWIKRAHQAEDAADAAVIRALLAQPYLQDGEQR